MAKQDTNPGPDVEEALDAFASGSSIQARQAALTALMRTKAIPKRADDARFQRGLEALIQAATDPEGAGESRMGSPRAGEIIRRDRRSLLCRFLLPSLRSATAQPVLPVPKSSGTALRWSDSQGPEYRSDNSDPDDRRSA